MSATRMSPNQNKEVANGTVVAKKCLPTKKKEIDNGKEVERMSPNS